MIRVENLSKKYVLPKGEVSAYSTLVETLSHKAKNIFSKNSSAGYEDFWALQDINFSLQEGDRLGIIGSNGAGKSTLLKILSKITPPTSGKVTIQGRLASLLEVGTGFHPELTGKENIFLSGAILGMSKQEIQRKFDDIVSFAGVERFLKTPVKRYSSGMYTRLGFAVAAHLDPDILIVDEVLAVGDADFQEKCLKKLGNLSALGRTVIFVSHDMGAVLSLCNKGLFLDKGTLQLAGTMEECMSAYMQKFPSSSFFWEGASGNESICFYRASLEREDASREFFYQDEKVRLKIDYEILKPSADLFLGLKVFSVQGKLLGEACTSDDPETFSRFNKKGRHTATFLLDTGLFYEGDYVISLHCKACSKKEQSGISLKFPVYSKKKNTWNIKPSGEPALFLGNQWEI